LRRLEVDERGLDGMDRRYCAPSPSTTAAARSGSRRWRPRSGEQRDVLEEVIEPYLLQQGFLQRTPRGRMLTEIAFRHLDLPLPAACRPARPARRLARRSARHPRGGDRERASRHSASASGRQLA
jgi:Holliday junction DNA helicase RuvB